MNAHNSLLQDERGKSTGLREELLNEDESHMSTHIRINQASLIVKLEQMSETLDGSLKLL